MAALKLITSDATPTGGCIGADVNNGGHEAARRVTSSPASGIETNVFLTRYTWFENICTARPSRKLRRLHL
eukprot:12228352-Karenia_brevis.AAC.1